MLVANAALKPGAEGRIRPVPPCKSRFGKAEPRVSVFFGDIRGHGEARNTAPNCLWSWLAQPKVRTGDARVQVRLRGVRPVRAAPTLERAHSDIGPTERSCGLL